MEISRFKNASKYYQRVESYLLNDEAAHCLLIGLSKALANSQQEDANFPYLVTVEQETVIVATAIRTSPIRKLVLSKSTNLKAVNLFAEDLATLPNKSLPGVIGLKSEATTFALTWQFLTRQTSELACAMRIHQLETAQSVTKTSGRFRMATESDRSILTNWIQAFEGEALGDSEPKSDCQSWFEKNLQQKSLFIWQDKVPVSMAAFGGATPNGVKINAVYTPPEFRGRGYATSCVAALSQQLLSQGNKYCFLFTNLANPISNHIYQKIGYQPVCEISNYNFKSSW